VIARERMVGDGRSGRHRPGAADPIVAMAMAGRMRHRCRGKRAWAVTPTMLSVSNSDVSNLAPPTHKPTSKVGRFDSPAARDRDSPAGTGRGILKRDGTGRGWRLTLAGVVT
jgi:hypothetical protein